jgi:sugar lactone lactonase YvrE
LSFDSAGNLYVADYYGGDVTKITPGGAQSTIISGLTYAGGVAVDSAGDVFVAEGASPDNILEIAPGGAQSTFATGLSNVNGMAFDTAGNLFVEDSGTGIIYEYTPGGVRSTVASGFLQPNGLAIQPVPEPSMWAMFGTGAFALLGLRRKA